MIPALLQGVGLGALLGLAAASLYLGTDPHLRPVFGAALADAAPRFLAVYLAAPDVIGHAFCARNPWRRDTCGRMNEVAYTVVDDALGTVLAATDPGATVFVVSDHGFDPERGHVAGWGLQGPPGIAILRGAGVRPGARIESASVYDVAPTILALFGIPVPRDWRGRPLLGAFEAERASALGRRRGPALPPRRKASDQPLPSPTDAEFKQRLRELGYIE